MKKKRFTEEQIIGILQEAQAGLSVADVCRKHQCSEQSFYRWKAKFGGMTVCEAKRLRELERENAEQVVAKLRAMKLNKAADLVAEKIEQTLTYYRYPPSHWARIKTNNPLERIMREVRRQTRVVGAFPDGHSALMLVGARLRHIAGTKWGTRKYLRMELLDQEEIENQLTT